MKILLLIPLLFSFSSGNNGDVYTTDGGGNFSWEAPFTPGVLSEHTDVSAATPTEADVLTFTSGEWTPVAPAGGGFDPGNETHFEIGPTASVANGADIPMFVASPTRSNSNLGSSTDVYTRNSDTSINIENTGQHSISLCFTSSKGDQFDVKVNGVIWITKMGDNMAANLNYYFTAGDDVTVTRIGSGSAEISNMFVGVTRLSE